MSRYSNKPLWPQYKLHPLFCNLAVIVLGSKPFLQHLPVIYSQFSSVGIEHQLAVPAMILVLAKA